MPAGGQAPQGIAVGIGRGDVGQYAPDSQLLLREVPSNRVEELFPLGDAGGHDGQLLRLAQLLHQLKIVRGQARPQAGDEGLDSVFQVAV